MLNKKSVDDINVKGKKVLDRAVYVRHKLLIYFRQVKRKAHRKAASVRERQI